MDKLTQLSRITKVVADTGDMAAIAQFKPEEATTNPSLLLKAAQQEVYASQIADAVQWAQQQDVDSATQLSLCCDRLAASIGTEILKLIPGRVSTEVDARLSYNTRETIERAHRLLEFYEEQGIARERILIKVAATWEGIRAAEVLEREGIGCNLTLLFGMAQAQACADAGVTLISPFVGRILDWHLHTGDGPFTAEEDPGVRSVREIYAYYKRHGYSTTVMGASFRNQGQIEALAGCDSLTISPDLLAQLKADEGTLERKLNPATSSSDNAPAICEADFRIALNQSAMAYEKLGEGIRRFVQDQQKLESQLNTRSAQPAEAV